MKAGGQVAANLSELYDYMSRRLLKAMIENKTELFDEVTKLLHEIRGAWTSIPPQARAR
jgi:flagellar protein FliS